MPGHEKLLGDIRNNPRDVDFKDLRLVLEDFGFRLTQSRGTSHWQARHASLRYLVTIPVHGSRVRPVYVRQALRAIDEVIDREEES